MSPSMNLTYTPENVLLANEFMQFINDSYTKRWKRFQFQLAKLQATKDEGAEDVFTETLLKCQDRILREGLPDGKAFGAYFDRATENNLVQFLMKTKNQGRKHLSFVGIPEESVNQLDGTTDEYLLKRMRNTNIEYDLIEDPLDSWDIVDLPDASQLHQEHVSRLFQELPEKYREVIQMVSDGLRYREIERTLNLSKGQVKMRILTARRLMNEKLAAAQYPEDASDFLDYDDEGSDY